MDRDTEYSRTVSDALMAAVCAVGASASGGFAVACVISAPGWTKMLALLFVMLAMIFAAFGIGIWKDET